MGLQTLDRAMAALHALGASGPEGLRFVDLQKALGLTKPTAHRLLQSLLSHGMLQHEPVERRYRLGPGLQLLAQSARHPGPVLRRICTPAVQRLAEESGDTVFLSARDGLFTVCLSRATGDYPIRAITVDVGSRRPLGVGAGGLAILGELPVEESARIIEVLGPKFAAFPLTSAEQITKSCRLAGRNGYALSDERVAVGVRAVGVAIHDAAGAPIAAIGLAAIRQRVSAERIPELVGLLQRERATIEKAVVDARPDGVASSQSIHRK
jgi:DNA-binding IclR family transcriptional regulator